MPPAVDFSSAIPASCHSPFNSTSLNQLSLHFVLLSWPQSSSFSISSVAAFPALDHQGQRLLLLHQRETKGGVLLLQLLL